MKQGSLTTPFVVVVVGVVAACGFLSTISASAANAAIQATDLPKSLQRCDGSGGMDNFLQTIQSTDTNTYRKLSSDWTVAKKDGAIAAQVITASDSGVDCNAMRNQPGGDIASPSAPVLINVVFQFKDEIGAVKGYARDSIMALRAADVEKLNGVVQGNSTGLGKNSVAISLSSLFVAFWQSRQFFLMLTTVHVDSSVGKKIATRENDRIAKFSGGTRSTAPGALAFRPSPVSVNGVVGQPLALTDATVTVASVNVNGAPPDGHAKPAAGDRFVSVDIEVEYTRTGNRFDWELSDSSGFKYDTAYSEVASSSPNLAGDTARGLVYFEVPEIATGLILKVTVGDDSATVHLG